MTNTERRVQKLHQAVSPPGLARPDWQIITDIARLMGYEEQFSYETSADIFREITEVSPGYHGITWDMVSRLDGVFWPCPVPGHPGTAILYAERFSHPDGKGVFCPVEWKAPSELPDSDYPFRLTTGRVIWHWHTGTMTRRSESLEREEPTGWIEMHPEDAKALGVKNNEMVKAISRRGEITIKARITDTIKKGVMFIPFHFVECAANMLTINALDPIAKIPESKACAIKVEKIQEA